VQAPHDTQGFNRYAYVRNNPLRYTDPSGFCFNGHPAADHLAQQCMQQILVQASRWMTDWSWVSQLGQWDALRGAMAEAGAAQATGIEEIIVDASRTEADQATGLAPALPALWLYGADNLLSRGLAMFSTVAAVTALAALPAEISETSDLYDDNGSPKFLYHFTNDTGKRGISASGVLMPGDSGRVYFTVVPYPTASQAQSALALPRTPSGYFAVPRQNVPGPLTWTTVAPNFGQPGGGLEASYPGAVTLEGAQWFSVRP
jgi:hypothetical protein